MITFAAVNVQNFEGRGAEYVANLFRGIARHMPEEWRGVCLTDDPGCVPYGVEAAEVPGGLIGWWSKMALFRPGMFRSGERVVYFDLDTVIVGDLSDLASYRGRFAMLRDVASSPYGSGIMAFEAGACNRIWTEWEAKGRPRDRFGDQKWIGYIEPDCDGLNHLYPGQLASFKLDVMRLGGVSDDTRAVYFHGSPRPHEVGWLAPV